MHSHFAKCKWRAEGVLLHDLIRGNRGRNQAGQNQEYENDQKSKAHKVFQAAAEAEATSFDHARMFGVRVQTEEHRYDVILIPATGVWHKVDMNQHGKKDKRHVLQKTDWQHYFESGWNKFSTSTRCSWRS